MGQRRVRRQAPRQPGASRNKALCLAPPEKQDQTTAGVGACAAHTRPRRAVRAAARRARSGQACAVARGLSGIASASIPPRASCACCARPQSLRARSAPTPAPAPDRPRRVGLTAARFKPNADRCAVVPGQRQGRRLKGKCLTAAAAWAKKAHQGNFTKPGTRLNGRSVAKSKSRQGKPSPVTTAHVRANYLCLCRGESDLIH